MRRLSRPRFSGAQKSLRMEVRRLKAKDLGELGRAVGYKTDCLECTLAHLSF